MKRLTSIGKRLDLSPEAFAEPRASNDALDDVAELQHRIDTDGYLWLRGFLDREEVLAAGRDVAASLVEPAGSHLQAGAAKRTGSHVQSEAGQFPAVRALLTSGRIMGFYERLLGGPVRAYDYIWIRTIRPGQVTGPHCDIVYMGRGTQDLYTSWVPLGDVPLEQGPLLILEGSNTRRNLHANYLAMDIDRNNNWRKIRLRHWKLFRGGDYSRNPAAVRRQFGLRWLTTSYRAGDLIVFTAHTMHGSLDNVSDVIRISADTRYQLACEPMDERWIGDHPIGHSQDQHHPR